MQISIITKDQEFFDLLSQHQILDDDVSFVAYPDVATYHKSSEADSLVIIASDINHSLTGDKIININQEQMRPYHLNTLFDLIQKYTSPSKYIELNGYNFSQFDKVIYKDNNKVDLTEKEAQIVACLLKIYPASVSRKELLETVWGYGDQMDSHTLETHIYRLRKKIESLSGQIISDSGGYKIQLG